MSDGGRARIDELKRFIASEVGADNVHAQLGYALSMLDGLLNRGEERIQRKMLKDWRAQQPTEAPR